MDGPILVLKNADVLNGWSNKIILSHFVRLHSKTVQFSFSEDAILLLSINGSFSYGDKSFAFKYVLGEISCQHSSTCFSKSHLAGLLGMLRPF